MATIRLLKNRHYRADIRYKSRFIKNKTFPNKQLAEAWAASYESKIQEIIRLPTEEIKQLSPDDITALGGGELFNKLAVTIPEVYTLAMIADEYMLQWEGKDTTMTYRVEFWIKHLGQRPIQTLTPADIRHALKIHKKNTSRNTQLRYKAAISTLFRFAGEELYIDPTINPARQVFIKPVPNEIVRYLSSNERKRLLTACRQSKWEKLYLITLMAMSTGMRKSELMQLSWNDIDFDRWLAMLSDSKNGSPRQCPIPEITMEELKRFREVGNCLIFCSRIDKERPYYYRDLWNIALRQSEVKNFRFHDLRHDFCSQLAMNDVSTHEIKDLAGHKTIQTTQRYIHLSTAHKSKIANRVMSKVLDV